MRFACKNPKQDVSAKMHAFELYFYIYRGRARPVLVGKT